MKKLEIILSLLIPIAILLKAFEVSSANPFISASLGTVSLFYIFLFWRVNKFKPSLNAFFDFKNPKKSIESLSGISIAMICIGVLFKLMSWPGGKMNLIVGVIFLALPTIILLAKRKEIENEFEKLSLARIFYYGFIGLIFLLVETDSSSQGYSNKPNSKKESNSTEIAIESKYCYYIYNDGKFKNVLLAKNEKSVNDIVEYYSSIKYGKEASLIISEMHILHTIKMVEVLWYNDDSSYAKVRFDNITGYASKYTLHDSLPINMEI